MRTTAEMEHHMGHGQYHQSSLNVGVPSVLLVVILAIAVLIGAVIKEGMEAVQGT